MASTNKTTHFNLSQYVGADKPTYLVDYNTDMQNIDAGIYSAKQKSDSNEISIGDIELLETTEKSNLVGAINEINEIATDNEETIDSLQSTVNQQATAIEQNTSKIGTIANLETTEKTNLVGAVNEILEKLNLNDITQFEKANMTITGGSISSGYLRIAKNSDSSLCKIYGRIRIAKTASTATITIRNTGLVVSEKITISPAGFENAVSGDNSCSIEIDTDGSLIIKSYGAGSGNTITAFFLPYLIILKNFGDIA